MYSRVRIGVHSKVGVPGTIAQLSEAGIAIWVLTGDKEETAVNIGFACQLLNRSMRRMHFNGKVMRGRGIGRMKTSEELRGEILAAIERSDQHRRKAGGGGGGGGGGGEDMSIVIDGDALETVFPNSADFEAEVPVAESDLAAKGSLRSCLLCLAQRCRAVVACRVSPKQKSLMVKLVTLNTRRIKTLAIGDGANDVPMIQAAHVGVGISGQEGMQAVNASDFALGQFRFLSRLLLVHGRWNYRRMSTLICYMFYKNFVLCLVPFFASAVQGFSGAQFLTDFPGIQCFNLFYTGMPVVFFAILDQDVSARSAGTVPQLYRTGIVGRLFNSRVFWSWVALAVWHSLVIFFCGVFLVDTALPDGQVVGGVVFGGVSFMIIVWVTNGKLMLEQRQWRRPHVFW